MHWLRLSQATLALKEQHHVEELMQLPKTGEVECED
jgi:hypothetical protein